MDLNARKSTIETRQRAGWKEGTTGSTQTHDAAIRNRSRLNAYFPEARARLCAPCARASSRNGLPKPALAGIDRAP
jgi:hypothetical protein